MDNRTVGNMTLNIKSRAFNFATVHVFLIFFIGLMPLIAQQHRGDIISQLDIKPNEDQVNYSPADGDTINVNPPPFTWLPVNRDMYFRSDAITRTGIEISTYPLDRSLEPGEWFWRYGAELENGETLYSKTRRIIVPRRQ